MNYLTNWIKIILKFHQQKNNLDTVINTTLWFSNTWGGGGGVSSASVEEEKSPTSTAMKNKNRLKTFNNIIEWYY